MSEATKAAFEAALEAHIYDEADAALVTGYVVMVANANEEDFSANQTGYSLIAPDNQPYHVGLGLAHRLRMVMENEDSEY